jgi:hypothetical protein
MQADKAASSSMISQWVANLELIGIRVILKPCRWQSAASPNPARTVGCNHANLRDAEARVRQEYVSHKGFSVAHDSSNLSDRKVWIEPEVRELNVRETFAFPGTGADVGGNPFPDCQLS